LVATEEQTNRTAGPTEDHRAATGSNRSNEAKHIGPTTRQFLYSVAIGVAGTERSPLLTRDQLTFALDGREDIAGVRVAVDGDAGHLAM
jgi:hypothetical protein